MGKDTEGLIKGIIGLTEGGGGRGGRLSISSFGRTGFRVGLAAAPFNVELEVSTPLKKTQCSGLGFCIGLLTIIVDALAIAQYSLFHQSFFLLLRGLLVAAAEKVLVMFIGRGSSPSHVTDKIPD